MVFNRFTREARLCVEAAVEEARMLGHDSVGDEDLLLGILRADDGAARKALDASGVSLKDAREEAVRMFAGALASIGIPLDEVRRGAGEAFEMRNLSSRRLPFSPSAKRALEQALHESVRLEDNRITGEHILLGVLRDRRGQGTRLLAGLGVPVESLEDQLNREWSRG